MSSHFRDSSEPLLSFNQGGRFLTSPFVPSAISMDPATGRVYHPASDKVGGVGLVADKLSILWTKVSDPLEIALMKLSDDSVVLFLGDDDEICCMRFNFLVAHVPQS